MRRVHLSHLNVLFFPALHSKNGPIRDCLADANLDGYGCSIA